MSRKGRLTERMAKLPTVLRTVAHVRPAQARAQLVHMLTGVAGAARLSGAPPRLAVAAPDTAFLEPPPHVAVRASGDGALVVELLARQVALAPGRIAWDEPVHGPLFAYHLHEQSWLRHPAVAPEARRRILDDWITNHARGVGWDPHPISLRLLAWGKLLLSAHALPEDDALRDRMAGSMADQAETLARGLEVRLQANHLLSNRIGVVWAGLLFEGARAAAWREQSGALTAELEAQIRPDGGHEERSPMYHALLFEGLLDLLNLARRSPHTPHGLVDALTGVTRRMVEALALFTGPDGRITLFADSAWGVAAAPAALFDYARRLDVIEAAPAPTGLAFDGSGYVRLEGGPFVLIASTAGPSPPHQPGHAHCDALAFELFVDGHRLVSDTGVFEYQPGAQRTRARATRSHATLAFDGAEQSEIWSAHRVGGRARVALLEAGADSFRAEATGWSRKAPRHVRSVVCAPSTVTVEDEVEEAGHAAESRLPIAPEWRVSLDGDTATCRHRDDDIEVRIRLDAGLAWAIERDSFHPSFHREVPRDVLVGRGTTPLSTKIVFERP